MRDAVRKIVPQRWRLRLWLAYRFLTPGAFRLRRAQPSLRQRAVARVELARRAATDRRGGVSRLSGIRVINLPSETERLAATMDELLALDIRHAERFEAVARDDGALGCALSHLACLEEMGERGWTSMLVCEDDAEFLVDRSRLDVLVDAFLDDPRAEVACLAYFVWESRPYDRLYLQATSVQTCACYLLKRSIAGDLAEVWRDGAERLARGEPAAANACDRSWAKLQRRHVFLVPAIRVARQRPAYSAVERRPVRYGH